MKGFSCSHTAFTALIAVLVLFMGCQHDHGPRDG